MSHVDLGTHGEEIEQADTSEMDGKHLTFWTEEQLFGIPIVDVVQIVGMQEITEIPEFPQFAKGIINLRGEIIPVIDMRLRLGKLEIAYNERTCIIVEKMQERFIGLIVDQVDEVTDIPEDLIVPPPTVSGVADSYLTGIATLPNRVVLLIDSKKLFGGQDLWCEDTSVQPQGDLLGIQ